MRIYIIGGPGSGKSYLARRLSESLKIPVLHLDDIHWDEKDVDFTVKAPEKERDRKFREIVKKKDWIIEGAFNSWISLALDKADHIILLKVGKYLRALRLCARNVKAWLGIVDRKVGSFKASIELAKWNLMWDKEKMPEIERMVKKYKVLCFGKADRAIEYVREKQDNGTF